MGTLSPAFWISSFVDPTCESSILRTHYPNGHLDGGTQAKSGISSMPLLEVICRARDSRPRSWRCCPSSFGYEQLRVSSIGLDDLPAISRPRKVCVIICRSHSIL